MSNVKVEVNESHPWKNERYFSSFEEADQLRKSLKAYDKPGTLQVKVKRCGVGSETSLSSVAPFMIASTANAS